MLVYIYRLKPWRPLFASSGFSMDIVRIRSASLLFKLCINVGLFTLISFTRPKVYQDIIMTIMMIEELVGQ